MPPGLKGLTPRDILKIINFSDRSNCLDQLTNYKPSCIQEVWHPNALLMAEICDSKYILGMTPSQQT